MVWLRNPQKLTGFLIFKVVIAYSDCYTSASILLRGEDQVVEVNGFPRCVKCDIGELVPLSDFGSQGAAIHYKAWACTNPDCGFNLKIRNGDLYVDEPISNGAGHQPRIRA